MLAVYAHVPGTALCHTRDSFSFTVLSGGRDYYCCPQKMNPGG